MAETDIDTLKINIKSDSSDAIRDLEAIAAALERIKQAGKLTTVSNNLKKINDNLGGLKDSTKNMKTLAEYTEKLQNSASGLKEVTSNLKNTANGLKKVNQEASKLSKKNFSFNIGGSNGSSSGSSLFNTKNIMTGSIMLGMKQMTDYISDGVTTMGGYIESVQFFNRAMGDYAVEAGEYAERIESLMGIDIKEWISGQSTFMSMAVGFGIAEDTAYKMSKGLTEIAYDMASVHSETADVTEAMTKLRSALAGEIEPLRAWGVSLTEAMLKELALEKGITKNIEAMTEAEKAQLRYVAIVETASNQNIIGNFANELKQPIAVIRILKNQITLLGRTIGSVFLPILAQIIPYITAFVKVVVSAIRSLAALFNFKIPEWGAKDWESGVVSVGSAAEDANTSLGGATKKAKELKKALMGFDELNVLPSPTDTSSGGGAGVGASGGDLGLDIGSVWDESILAKAENQANSIIERFKELGKTIKTTFVENKQTLLDFVGVLGAVTLGIMAWKTVLPLFTAFHGNLGVIQGAFAMIVYRVAVLKNAVVGFITASSPLFVPMVAVIGAVASVVYTLWKNFDLVVAIAKDFIAKIKLTEKLSEIKAACEPLLKHVAQLGDLLEVVGTVILTVLQPMIGLAMGLFGSLINVITPLITIVDGVISIFAGLGTFLKGVFTADIDLVKQGISTFATGVSNIFSGLISFVDRLIMGFVSGFIGYFSSLFSNVGTIVTNIKNRVVSIFTSMKDGTISIISNLINWGVSGLQGFANSVGNIVSGIWSTVSGFYKKYIQPVFTSNFWINAFAGLKNGFNSVVRGMLNAGIDLINSFIRWLNSKLRFSWSGLSIAGKQIFSGGSVQLVRLTEITQRFQDGGFIEDGLFTMNKGEIAGQFDNGKSVVANNYQITEGISKAVYEAITRANGFGSKDITFNATFEMDSEVVGKKVIKYHNGIVNQTGESPLTI